jgi:hypothetical protein
VCLALLIGVIYNEVKVLFGSNNPKKRSNHSIAKDSQNEFIILNKRKRSQCKELIIRRMWFNKKTTKFLNA